MASNHFSFKKGGRGRGHAHFHYITGTGNYSEKEDVVHVHHCNYPAWCQDNPALFWHLGDQLTRANGKVYSEFEAALPRELPIPSLIELAESFAKNMLADKHVYTVAVHAALASDGGTNPNMHIMFNERLVDDIERGTTPRGPEVWFRRFNAESPAQGGCQVDPFWNDRECPNRLRIAWETLCNEYLIKHGIDRKIDMRSNWQKGIGKPIEPKIGVGPGAAARKKVVDQIRHGLDSTDLENGSLSLLNGSDPIGQIICAENGDAAHIKKRILERAIHASVSEAFARELWFVRMSEEFTWVVFRAPPGGIKDSGPSMTAHGMPDASAAQRLIELAKAKKWTQIRCTGEAAFVREAIRLALAAGIEVIPANDAQGFILESLNNTARYHAAIERLPQLKQSIAQLQSTIKEIESQESSARHLDCLTPNVKSMKEAVNVATRRLGGEQLNYFGAQYLRAKNRVNTATSALENSRQGLFNLIRNLRLRSELKEASEHLIAAQNNYLIELKKIDGKKIQALADDLLKGSEQNERRRDQYSSLLAKLNAQLTCALEEQKNLLEFVSSMDEFDKPEDHTFRKPRPGMTR